MSLATFADLKASVADYLQRSDLTAVIPDFFTQAQSKLYYGHQAPPGVGLVPIKPLRIRQMMSSATVTPTTGGVFTIATACDAKWVEFIELTPTFNGAQSIDYLEPYEFKKRQDLLLSTTPPAVFYTIEGDVVYLAPAAITPIRAAWYQKFTALSGASDTDWVLTNAPQVYLDGCLAEACKYLLDDREASFRASFAGGILGLNLNDQRARSSGALKRAIPRAVA